MTAQTAREIFNAKLNSMPTDATVGALEILTAKEERGEKLTTEELMVRGGLCRVLEARHPEMEPALEAWGMDEADERSMGRVIIGLIKAMPATATS